MGTTFKHIILFASLVIHVPLCKPCITRAGDQIFLDDPIEEAEEQWYKGVEIYANKFTPDKCNYGEWNKGDYPAAYMRKMRYKGFVVITKDPEGNQGPVPIKGLERLMDIVEQRAKDLGANMICGGKIEKSPYNAPAPNSTGKNEFVYEFTGIALHSGPPVPPELANSSETLYRFNKVYLLFNVIVMVYSKVWL